MILTFTRIPQSQPCDLSTAFDPMQTTPDVASKIGQINENRNKFYSESSKAIRAPLHEIQDGLDWMSMLQYLNNGPDLLDIAVKKANYPLVFKYIPITTDMPIVSQNDNEVGVSLEIIFSRIIYALSINRSCSGYIHELRKARQSGNPTREVTVAKTLGEVLMNSMLRLYKLRECKNFIYPGLKGLGGCLETDPIFVHNLYQIFELNYTSAVIDKMAASISPSNSQLLSKVARLAYKKTLHLKEVFNTNNWESNKAIRCWLGIAAQYFEMMTLWSIYMTNDFEKSKLLNTPKTIDTIYYEDMLIGQRLIQYKKEFEGMSNSTPNLEPFNYKENCLHAVEFLTDSKLSKFQEGITKFAHVKDSLELKKFDGRSLEVIMEEVDVSQDIIAGIIQKQCGL